MTQLVSTPSDARLLDSPDAANTPNAAPSVAELRDLFLIDPSVVFLNHGSFGACPRPVFERYQAWELELERQPVEFLGRRFYGLMANARAGLAAYVGTAPENLVYVPNATHAVNIVARSLKLGPGDEVVGTDHEYGACDRTWRFLCAKTGATYKPAKIDVPLTTPEALIAAVWAEVTPRTRVLFLSHITSATAVIFPVAELCAMARAAGILTLVDGAHVPGQLPLDLDRLGADFYTGNCHKWLCSPKGAAFLYARPTVQHLVEPLVVSWGWEPIFPGTSPFIDQQEFTGTRDIAAYLTVPDAIAFQAEHRWDEVRPRCHALIREARARLIEIPGVTALHPDDPTWYFQMVAVVLPPCDALDVGKRLYDGYRVEVPVYDWNDRPILRVSIQGYNAPEEVEVLASALRSVLAAVA